MSRFTHDHRLRTRLARANKGLKAFLQYLVLISDLNPVYCFLCGNYIHPRDKELEFATQPFGKKCDWVHRMCYNRGITYEIANQKIDENSLLICHYETFTNYHPEGVCRKKIKNDKDNLLNHLKKHEGFSNNEDDIDFIFPIEVLQHEYFLKPTGKKFSKPKVI